MFFNKKIINEEVEKFNELRFERNEKNLRDWFAGQMVSELCREQWTGSQFDPGVIANRAYEVAECMMNERRKRDEKLNDQQ